jgi:hypothetical protein
VGGVNTRHPGTVEPNMALQPIPPRLYKPGVLTPRVRDLYGRRFSGSKLDVVCAVVGGESSYYLDAVGDVSLVDQTWGPSLGSGQIRTKKAAKAGTARHVDFLRRPINQVEAMWELSAEGTNWRPWSVFTSGAFEQYLGLNPRMLTNYPTADRWTSDGHPIVYVGYLAEGQRHPSVRRLQRRLVELGFDIPAGPTGFYGPQTIRAVTEMKSTWDGFRYVPQADTSGDTVGVLQAQALWAGTDVEVVG